MLLILTGFAGIAHASQNETPHSTIMPFEEHYEIEIFGLEDKYFTDEEYSFYFVISGYGYSCAGYQVSYPDVNGLLIGMGAEPLCDPETSMYEFEIKSLDRHGILGNTVIKKPGNYTVTVTFEKPNKYFPTTVSKEFRIVESITDDSTLLYPLKQFKLGIPFSEIKCNANLQLTQRHDGTPACVKDGTVFELIKRGWTSDIIRLVQSRDVFLDPKDPTSSYMDRIIPTLEDFKNILSKPYDIDNIFSKFGQPHKDSGSGIHIYVYELNDFTEIWIGYVDDIWYVKHVDANGNVLEDLFVKNEG